MKKPRLMVIGLDSVSLSLLDAFRESCPNIRRLMRQGTAGRAISAFPIYTPTNWAALSTGADSSTTAAEGWYNDIAGRKLSTFDRRAIACDTIFDSAARGGLRTLAISYPSSHPTASARNMVLAPLDRGLVSNCLVPGKIVDVKFDRQGRFDFVLLAAPMALGGSEAAKAVGATEDGASSGVAMRKVRIGDMHATLVGGAGKRWRLESPERRAMTLREGAWSMPIDVRLVEPGRPGRCVVRVMVFAGGSRLAVSEAYDIGALGKPAGLAKAAYEKLGAPIEHSVFYNQTMKLFAAGQDDPTITALARRDLTAQVDWIVNAAELTQKTVGFDVFYLHYHYPDSLLHKCLSAIEGLSPYSRRQQAIARAAMRMCMGICDRLVAGLLKLAGSRTTVLLVSDHGNVPNTYACNIGNRLAEESLMVRNADGKPDTRKSLAWPAGGVATWIAVNAREGTVRYADLQDKVIDALLDWRSPDGKRVVALALRKKDSHLLGYYGPRIGDVTFHYNSGFSWFGKGAKSVYADSTDSNHGPQMPVTFSKMSDNLAFYVLRGPHFAANRRRDEKKLGFIRIVDLAPTVCFAADVPPPRDATGAVRHDLMK